uniref:Solute carrier family 15 member 1a n=1 Tax=Petromyzon marinus TaxID=7757 RepID=S4RYJ4_PETMA
YPISIAFIVVNEFCERFSYYGMKAVLVLYFRYFLHWNNNTATSVYHAFSGLCYFTPVLGAIIADSWLGKFKTIIYLSIIYVLGHVVKSIGALPDVGGHTVNVILIVMVLAMVGLGLIALGTGGIKPCVAAFGGDQFHPGMDHERGKFFSIFYLSINAGSLISTFVTPILRDDVQCFGADCYALAFGVPAILMVLALVVFIGGSSTYTKNPPEGNVLVNVSNCIGFAIKNRWNHRGKQFPKRDHWLDWAKGNYNDDLIMEVKMVLRVLFLYIPLPMFWALFDQQGSRWTLQATTMTGDFFQGAFVLKPDQMQTINPILILVLIPIFDVAIYPLIRKCGINFSPLRRMAVGMILAALAFVAAALVQLEIDKTLPDFPSSGEFSLRVINAGAHPLNIQFENDQFDVANMSVYSTFSTVLYFICKDIYTVFLQASVHKSFNIVAKEKPFQIVAFRNGTMFPCSFNAEENDLVSKPEEGMAAVRFVGGNSEIETVNIGTYSPVNVSGDYSFTDYQLVFRGKKETCKKIKVFLDFGAAYTILLKPISKTLQQDEFGILMIQDLPENSINLAWQVPQYFLLTAAEVMFSVTGLEFSYSQAPTSMKSVLQAGWLLTVAFGNVIVLIVAEGANMEQWVEFILFACLLFVVFIIFSIMAYFYVYVDPSNLKNKEKEEKGSISSLDDFKPIAAETDKQT